MITRTKKKRIVSQTPSTSASRETLCNRLAKHDSAGGGQIVKFWVEKGKGPRKRWSSSKANILASRPPFRLGGTRVDLTTPNRPKVSVKAKINEIGKKALERTRELGVRCRSASTNKKSSSGAVKMKSEQFLQKRWFVWNMFATNGVSVREACKCVRIY